MADRNFNCSTDCNWLKWTENNVTHDHLNLWVTANLKARRSCLYFSEPCRRKTFRALVWCTVAETSHFWLQFNVNLEAISSAINRHVVIPLNLSAGRNNSEGIWCKHHTIHLFSINNYSHIQCKAFYFIEVHLFCISYVIDLDEAKHIRFFSGVDT